MSKQALTIATRKSPMAMWQAEHIKQRLKSFHPELNIDILGVSTSGDRDKQTPLIELGGKNVFVKEIQQQLLAGNADIAVHCVKDMSAHSVAGLQLAVICERDDARDAFVSNQYDRLDDLPHGASIGTGSPRRESQLKALRPDINIKPIRGNVDTRLKKLDDGEYDAIILSAAGLTRMNLAHRIKYLFQPQQMIPAIGQGALGIECRGIDVDSQEIISVLDHAPSHLCVAAERAVNQRLCGDCHTPLGAYATLNDNDELHVTAMVGNSDGSIILRSQQHGNSENAQHLGIGVANDLIAQGAHDML
ncbi:MAG: hydroxymethylbilane synthase [Coxiellaceae bacterium]|nr:hydroxymethylbilane synthase [Coxiellaceae bacterium]